MNWFIRLLKRLFKRTTPMSAERYGHHLAGVAILIHRLVEYGMSTNWVREITLLADSDDFLAVVENCKVAADEQGDPDLIILLWKISELAELIHESNPEEEEEDDAAEEEQPQ